MSFKGLYPCASARSSPLPALMTFLSRAPSASAARLFLASYPSSPFSLPRRPRRGIRCVSPACGCAYKNSQEKHKRASSLDGSINEQAGGGSSPLYPCASPCSAAVPETWALVCDVLCASLGTGVVFVSLVGGVASPHIQRQCLLLPTPQVYIFFSLCLPPPLSASCTLRSRMVLGFLTENKKHIHTTRDRL